MDRSMEFDGFKFRAVDFEVRRNVKREFTKTEEIIHAAMHGVAAVLGILGLVLLILKTSDMGATTLGGAIFFGASLIILYSASFFYHSVCVKHSASSASPIRKFAQKCDHSLIFLLILGTYVPVSWTAIGGTMGFAVFSIVAFSSVVGMILNIINVGKYAKVSLALNLLSGWAIVAVSVPFFNAIGPIGFNFLVAGGLFYTVGVIFYKLKSIPYMHIIWHLFVIFGTLMHYIMIYNYIYV